MLTFSGARRFDAVLGLYALSVLDGKGFAAAVSSARRALRPGGVFFFNVPNLEAQGPFPPGVNPPPVLFLSAAVNRGAVKVVRFNNLAIQDPLWKITSIYLIEDQGQTQLSICDDTVRRRRLQDVKAVLDENIFEFESVVYQDAMGYSQWDMHICAIAKRTTWQ
jgi:SAM-dependent methyltransferase